MIPAYIHTYIQLYPHNCFYFSILFTTPFVFPSFPVTTSARTHTHTPHTHNLSPHTTYSSTHHLLHPNPSPSLFFFLLSPCHLYLSFAACWKKLTCGVIRSFNFYIFGVPKAWRNFLGNKTIPSRFHPGQQGRHVLVAKVLPMGFKNSVSLAQHVHRTVVARGAGQAKGHLRGHQELRLSGMFSTECTLTILMPWKK